MLYFDCVDLSKPKDAGRIDLWVDGFFFQPRYRSRVFDVALLLTVAKWLN